MEIRLTATEVVNIVTAYVNRLVPNASEFTCSNSWNAQELRFEEKEEKPDAS